MIETKKLIPFIYFIYFWQIVDRGTKDLEKCWLTRIAIKMSRSHRKFVHGKKTAGDGVQHLEENMKIEQEKNPYFQGESHVSLFRHIEQEENKSKSIVAYLNLTD